MVLPPGRSGKERGASGVVQGSRKMGHEAECVCVRVCVRVCSSRRSRLNLSECVWSGA